MFISYAQNGEDIVLWRALGHIAGGTYVDVGAADPTHFSVTKAFYDRGWSGLNVEPGPEFVDLLRAQRERDTTVAVCAGAAAGTITFHYVAGTGLSTTSDSHLATIADNQFAVVDLDVDVQRLDQILADAGFTGRDIHFLKVDVEGAEESVLRGIDFATWRPWVVMVEATEPLSTEQNHAGWHALLADHGYQFTLFDGLNRFYVADEHPELVKALSYPAGIFDQPYTVGAGQLELAARAEALVRERDELQASYDRLHAEMQRTLEGYERVQEELQRTLAGYNELHATYEHTLAAYESASADATAHAATLEAHRRLQAQYDSLLQQQAAERAANMRDLQAANNHIAAMENTASWRVTKPLRLIRHSGHR